MLREKSVCTSIQTLISHIPWITYTPHTHHSNLKQASLLFAKATLSLMLRNMRSMTAWSEANSSSASAVFQPWIFTSTSQRWGSEMRADCPFPLPQKTKAVHRSYNDFFKFTCVKASDPKVTQKQCCWKSSTSIKRVSSTFTKASPSEISYSKGWTWAWFYSCSAYKANVGWCKTNLYTTYFCWRK